MNSKPLDIPVGITIDISIAILFFSPRFAYLERTSGALQKKSVPSLPVVTERVFY